MVNIVNDYFVNMLEMGNEATDAELVYLLVPNLPSKYKKTLLKKLFSPHVKLCVPNAKHFILKYDYIFFRSVSACFIADRNRRAVSTHWARRSSPCIPSNNEKVQEESKKMINSITKRNTEVYTKPAQHTICKEKVK